MSTHAQEAVDLARASVSAMYGWAEANRVTPNKVETLYEKGGPAPLSIDLLTFPDGHLELMVCNEAHGVWLGLNPPHVVVSFPLEER